MTTTCAACLFWAFNLNAAAPPTFSAPTLITLGIQPAVVAKGDFNGDGKPDLVMGGASDVLIALSKPDGSYQPPVSLGLSGINPTSIAVGDFNGDGKLDLAVANVADVESVVVLLGKGDGTFQPPASYRGGQDVESLAVGDFNGDGKLDLVTANKGSTPSEGSIAILLGNGDGTFQNALTYADLLQPQAVVVGDWNGDGKADLAVSESQGMTLSAWLGKGDGSFETPVDYNLAGYAGALATADFNNDGKPDLAVLTGSQEYGIDDNQNTVSVLLGNGDGTFRTPVVYLVGDAPFSSLTVADFNGDGKPDVAASYNNGGTVSILLGAGDGSFQLGAVLGVGACPEGLIAADLNGNGKADLAIADSCSFAVAILLGNGKGQFGPQPRSYSLEPGGLSIAVGDFNGDGKPDLAVANTMSDTLSILINKGNGAFHEPVSRVVGAGPEAVAVGDFNGDGNLDLALAIFGGGPQGAIEILLGKGNGTFAQGMRFPTGGNPSGVAVGDFNGDGNLDVAVINFMGNAGILLGNGDGTFQPAKESAAGPDPVSIGVGDFNGDGKLDLAVVGGALSGSFDSNVFILLGNGDGSFQAPVPYGVLIFGLTVAIGDFNGDGKPDLAVADYSSSAVSVLLGNGDGTFQPQVNYAVGFEPLYVVAGDFNGDGIPDLAIANNLSNTVSILLGKGDGTFQPAPFQFPMLYPQALAVGDFNNDGKADLAVSAGYVPVISSSTGTVSILLNTTQ
ncbi:MAG: VCBS repeat-containing protein [Bryobacteraceae bacterium]|jgi:hypothetical protein